MTNTVPYEKSYIHFFSINGKQLKVLPSSSNVASVNLFSLLLKQDSGIPLRDTVVKGTRQSSGCWKEKYYSKISWRNLKKNYITVGICSRITVNIPFMVFTIHCNPLL